MKAKSTIDKVDPDNIDDYFEMVDQFTVDMASADALAYNARQDNDSQTTFKLGASTSLSSGSKSLDQSKASVIKIRDSLEKIVKYLEL